MACLTPRLESFVMKRLFRWFCYVSAVAGLLGGLLALIAGPLHAGGTVDFAAAAQIITVGAGISVVAVLLGLVGTTAAALSRLSRSAILFGLIGIVAGGAVVLSVQQLLNQASGNPLHDVTTDLDRPPRPEALAARDYAGPNDRAAAAAFPHPDWRRQHADLYPDLTTARYALSVEEALARARAVAEAMGWQIVAADRTEDGARLEAVATTGWFGFKDNVIVRIEERDTGISLDARSVSRIGVSDLGANARRLRRFLARFEAA
ncbi:MAG: DUF1499 domain-containing protein [Rhodothalassiaceae bacterium]